MKQNNERLLESMFDYGNVIFNFSSRFLPGKNIFRSLIEKHLETTAESLLKFVGKLNGAEY